MLFAPACPEGGCWHMNDVRGGRTGDCAAVFAVGDVG